MNIIQKIEERVMELQAKGITPEIVYLNTKDWNELDQYIIDCRFLTGSCDKVYNPYGELYIMLNGGVKLEVKSTPRPSIYSYNLLSPVYKSRLEVPIKRLQGTLELISPGSAHLLHEDIDITGIV